jgi:hypothetical protein
VLEGVYGWTLGWWVELGKRVDGMMSWGRKGLWGWSGSVWWSHYPISWDSAAHLLRWESGSLGRWVDRLAVFNVGRCVVVCVVWMRLNKYLFKFIIYLTCAWSKFCLPLCFQSLRAVPGGDVIPPGEAGNPLRLDLLSSIHLISTPESSLLPQNLSGNLSSTMYSRRHHHSLSTVGVFSDAVSVIIKRYITITIYE